MKTRTVASTLLLAALLGSQTAQAETAAAETQPEAEKGFVESMKEAVTGLTDAVKDTAEDAEKAVEGKAGTAEQPAAEEKAGTAEQPAAEEKAETAEQPAAPAERVDLVKAVMGKVEHIKPERLKELLAEGKGIILLDIRQPAEIKEQAGITPEDVQIPRDFLELKAAEALPQLDTPIVTYCGKGIRSAFAVETLKSMGYGNVRNLSGGLEAWNQ